MNETIAGLFAAADSERQGSLRTARLCAALSKPWVLPPMGQPADEKLPENFQSKGSRGITNLEGRMGVALFPHDSPWFTLEPSAEAEFDPANTPEQLQEFKAALYTHEIIIQSMLEQADREEADPVGFRTTIRMALSQVLITGDVLLQLTDSLRLKVFRRDQYVTKRDSSGRVLFHIVVESIDVLSLPDETILKAGLEKPGENESASKRMKDLYTMVEWDPRGKQWKIRQELNGHTVNEAKEPVSPYISVPFELVCGENYGRGFVEHNLGDLRSLNTLGEKILDFAGMASKLIPCIDMASELKPEDLSKPSGSIITGARVVGGQVQDVAFLKVDKLTDFKIAYDTWTTLGSTLDAAMLVQSGAVRDSERTTAFEIAEVTIKELEGALGGFYAPVADRLQGPLLRRARHVLEKKLLLPTLPKKAVDIKLLTGLAALSRAAKAQRILSTADIITRLGPDALARINKDVLIDVVIRAQNVHEPGLIKTRAQVEQEVRDALQVNAAKVASEKAVDVAGNIVENAAAQKPAA